MRSLLTMTDHRLCHLVLKARAEKMARASRHDGSWVYRNVTQLLVRIESEQFIVIDANGDGIYNVANVDGMAWENEKYLFPLPPGQTLK